MIFTLLFLQSISIAFGTVTKIYDIEKLITKHLAHTTDAHDLYATSYDYMKFVQKESDFTARYFQSVRYILHGFPMPSSIAKLNSTNGKIHKKLNFIQSIVLYYCGMNMSYIVNTSLDNILINESQLYMNSMIFPVQLVESYEIIRLEICERIRLGSYQSIVDMFNPYKKARHSFFSGFVRQVANFISSTSCETFSLQNIGQMYPFLAKFDRYEPYKETVIGQIRKIDNYARASKVLGKIRLSDIDICVSQIKHPKMYKYVTNILEQQVHSTGNPSFILNRDKASNLSHYAQMYQLLTGSEAMSHHAESDIVEMRDLLQLLDDLHLRHEAGASSTSITLVDSSLIAFRIHESRTDGINGHEYVLNAIKCIISNHDIYCSQFNPLAIATPLQDHEFFMRKDNLRQSLSADVFYPYIDEIMKDTQFVNIVNNNTDSKINTYLQKILSNLMAVAWEKYKDVEMIKTITTTFKQKIDVCMICIPDNHSKFEWKSISLMNMLIKGDCMYLTKYFQQRFSHQVDSVDHCSGKLDEPIAKSSPMFNGPWWHPN